MPPWWAIFPPPEDVLRGMREQGYRDAARFFSKWECECKNPAVREISRQMRLPKGSDAAEHRSKYGNPECDKHVDAFHEAVRREWVRAGVVVALLAVLGAGLLNWWFGGYTLLEENMWRAHAFMMGGPALAVQ